MGLKSFLKERGFIEDEHNKKTEQRNDDLPAGKTPATKITPTFFPLQAGTNAASTNADNDTSGEPSFVSPLQQNTNQREELDPTFVKFFEDELVKANLPGPDYFEFRQQLIKTQQKMTAKGVAAPEVVLQAVIMSFEAQEVSPAKLIETAKHYKDAIRQKNEDFLKGAAAEKNNQLLKRQNVLSLHDENIKKLQQQLQQLDLQKQQLQESLNKEKTQMDVDKTLGQEGIEKIEKAERLISLAHDYIQSNIDTDIKRLQSV
ncbi:MAG: hypothetical protein M3015_00565 [Bacteroidota bacterium]|nr:hypothetical protein [Bacteroidota bacterium]